MDGRLLLLLNEVNPNEAKVIMLGDENPEEEPNLIMETPYMPLEVAKIVSDLMYKGMSHDISFHNTSLEIQQNV